MSALARYAFAAFTVAVAIALTSALADLLAPMRLFFLWAAVMITALVCGTAPALVATVLSIAAACFVIFEPRGTLAVRGVTDVLRLALFAVFAGGISLAVGRTRQLGARLRKSEQRYRTLVESTPVAQAVWTATPDGRVEWSSNWSAITGQTPEELAAGGAMKAVHPEDGARTWQRWTEALAQGSLYEDEIRVCVAGGRYRWFAIRASPVRRGNRIVEWVGSVVDIDERKRHAEESAFINRASELLSSTLDSDEAMRRLARLAVPALGDWCAIHLREGDDYRRLVAEHADPSRVALLERFGDIPRPSPEKDAILQVLRSGESQLVENVTDEMLRAMEREQHALVSALGLRSWIIAPMIARGRALGTLTVVCGDSGRHYGAEDVPLIEELARRAAVALDNAHLYEQAQAANRLKDEFLATLSHELRTPLTAISGWADMLAQGIADEQTRRLAIDTIVRSARAQGELINDLLDVSRVAAGTLHLHITSVDLVVLVHEAVAAIRPSADAKRLTLAFEPPPHPLIVRGDERRLRQIAWNLLTNAVKFTDAGGVTVSLSRSGAMARMDVSDTGRGIDPSFLPFVWERFRQADSSTSRQHGGLGLGLAVVRHLAEMHGGTVHAESEGPGRGATFCVEIPLAAAAAAERGPRPLPDKRTVLGGRRILVVDDDRDARVVIETMLARCGAQVSAVASVAEALRLIESQPFDLVVSDLAMPGQDGYSLPAKAGLPAVAVSAMSAGDERRRALEAGFTEFLRKPFEPSELVEAVLAALR